MYVQVTRNAHMQVLNAQGRAITFPGLSVQLPIMQTGDYIVLVRGNGAVTVIIAVAPT
jgi:hypothetical protein